MKTPLLPIVLLGAAALGLLGAGCGYEPLPGQGGQGGTTQAADYYPFTAGGNVIHWGLGSTIRVEIPDCPFANCLAMQFRDAVEIGITTWAPLHALLGLNVVIDKDSSDDPDDVSVVWDDGCGVAPGVIGFAAISPPPADPSRFILMTSGCNTCGPCPTPPSHDPDTIRDIALHEWGHMLGIWNHSFDPEDLMYPFRLDQGGISNRDAHTLFQAYRQAPDLNLAGFPQNTWTQSAAAGDGSDPLAGAFLIRYVHSYAEPWSTTLEFNPPEDW